MVSQDNNMRRRQQITITSVPLPQTPTPSSNAEGGPHACSHFSGKGVLLGFVSGRFPEKLLGWYSETGILSRGCYFGQKSASYNTATTVENWYSGTS